MFTFLHLLFKIFLQFRVSSFGNEGGIEKYVSQIAIPSFGQISLSMNGGMPTREQFGVNEWYHCYNRGVDQRKIFYTKKDYERFLLLMYIGNASVPIHISNLKVKRFYNALEDMKLERGTQLVEISAYSLMPNHFHFVLKEIRDGGIALFMQKIITGYTMYFNKKNERTGPLLAGSFKSKHVADDRYLKHLISYIHMNPIELFEPNWKEGRGNLSLIEKYIVQYPYGSLPDFLNITRLERKILGDSIFELFDEPFSLKLALQEAKSYYEDNFIKV